MKFPDKTTLEAFRKEYPKGSRVRLFSMDDTQALPIGTRGTVQGVDDAGNLLVKWDNGSGLNVVLGVDEVKKLDVEVTTCCLGNICDWFSKYEAKQYFLEAIENARSSKELERYLKIYYKIFIGEKFCSDSD